MKTFLMCYPQSFVVNYEINDWMKDKTGTVDNAIALEQWKELHKQLVSIGAKIALMKNQTKEVPDLVFTANAAIKSNQSVLLSHFANKERQAETLIYKSFLENIGYATDMSCVEENIYFEGAGDMLLHKQSNTHVLGYGFRTDKRALHLVEKFLHKTGNSGKVLQVNLVDSRFYHLDTCFCPLDNGNILYFPPAFSVDSQAMLKESFGDKLMAIEESDAVHFACNAVNMDRYILLNKASGTLLRQLLDKGFIVIETPLTEFLKAGGSAKCLTMEI